MWRTCRSAEAESSTRYSGGSRFLLPTIARIKAISGVDCRQAGREWQGKNEQQDTGAPRRPPPHVDATPSPGVVEVGRPAPNLAHCFANDSSRLSDRDGGFQLRRLHCRHRRGQHGNEGKTGRRDQEARGLARRDSDQECSGRARGCDPECADHSEPDDLRPDDVASPTGARCGTAATLMCRRPSADGTRYTVNEASMTCAPVTGAMVAST